LAWNVPSFPELDFLFFDIFIILLLLKNLLQSKPYQFMSQAVAEIKGKNSKDFFISFRFYLSFFMGLMARKRPIY